MTTPNFTKRQDNSILHSNFTATEGPSLMEKSHDSSVRRRTLVYKNGHCLSCLRYASIFHGRSILDEGTYDTRANHSALFITRSPSNECVAFHLPDSRSDRQIRIDFGAHHNLTASFPAGRCDLDGCMFCEFLMIFGLSFITGFLLRRRAR